MRIQLGHVAIREAADGDGRSIEGVALPWAAEALNTREYGNRRESFEPGSFARAIAALDGRPIAYLDDHEGRVVGTITAEETREGLAIRGRLLETQAARDYAEAVAAGIDGVSLEFLPGEVRRSRDRVTHTSVRQLVAVAGTYAPAYVGAHIALREDPRMIEETELEVIPATPTITAGEVQGMMRTELESFRREWAERQAMLDASPDPYASLRAYRSLGQLVQDIARAETTELRDIFARALADQITTNNPGVTTPGVVGEVRGIIAAGRPGVDAFGVEPLGGSGMSVDWPYFDGTLSALVGAQATQKSEITSVRVDLKKGTTPLATYAGGSDVALQLISRSSPSYLDAYTRILAAAYAVVTDAAFVNAVEAGATGSQVINFATATPEDIREALFASSVKVQLATGSPASFVLASAEAFQAIGGALNPTGTEQQPGTANARELAPVMSGLPVLFDPNVNTGTALISNRQAAAWHEDGPFSISALDVAKLGQNVAIWGMGATAIYLPAGIVKTAAAAVAAASSRK